MDARREGLEITIRMSVDEAAGLVDEIDRAIEQASPPPGVRYLGDISEVLEELL